MARVDLWESFTVKPSACSSVFQKGMLSQKNSTRGMPKVIPWEGATGVQGQSLKSNCSRSLYRFGTLFRVRFASRTCSRTFASESSPTTSPLVQRLPVIHEVPLENVMRVRLQRFEQNVQIRFVSCE